ncbi:UNVERIFIED_CONTAM: hypothetical protein Q9R58_22075 [Methylobacteriaceae bacterium AG10]|nr:hypothetical protein [Methylobacteriaceae bacterium AG10]
MSDQGEGRGDSFDLETVRLSAMHMAFVLTNTVGEMLNHMAAEHRQKAFFLMGAAALRAVDNVHGPAPDDVKASVQRLTHIYVENALTAVAKQLGLSLPEIKGDGPKQH